MRKRSWRYYLWMHYSKITHVDRPHNYLPNDIFGVAASQEWTQFEPKHIVILIVAEQCSEKIHQLCANIHNVIVMADRVPCNKLYDTS